MTPDREPSVLVYLDGKPVVVPERVESHYAARGALGIPRGRAVAREEDPEIRLTFEDGHTFVEGERYVSVYGNALFERAAEPLKPWEQDADAWRRR